MKLILLRMFKQHLHYHYIITCQSHEPEESYKPARIKEVQSKQYSFQALLCSLKSDILLHIHSAECIVRLVNQAGRNNYPYNPKYVGNTGNRMA